MHSMCETSSFFFIFFKEMQRETRIPPYRNKTFIHTFTHMLVKIKKKNTEKNQSENIIKIIFRSFVLFGFNVHVYLPL